MLAKWIVAEASNRAAFDEAQRRWAELLKYDGFIVQMGGCLESFSSKAGIFAVWRDFGAYRRFMESGHAELANQQRESYERIETSVASVSCESANRILGSWLNRQSAYESVTPHYSRTARRFLLRGKCRSGTRPYDRPTECWVP